MTRSGTPPEKARTVQSGAKGAQLPAPVRTVDELVTATRCELATVADPTRAGRMSRYMKGVAPFFGVPAPLRRHVTRSVRADALLHNDDALLEFAGGCFAMSEREVHYVAVDALEHRSKTLGENTLVRLRGLVQTKSWWDTVDPLSGIVGSGAVRYAGWREAMGSWATDPDMWIRRVAILHQLGRGNDTDLDCLFRIVLANAPDREFFIRKAIGWALRDLAWRQPRTVADFVERHRSDLSPLSVREATKNLPRLLGP